jgi:methionyl-tRNA synthetase
MTTSRVYLSTTIPYVNSRAHLGHALELVQADVLARHHRRIGDQVRFQSGTDDNSLKNVLAAQAAGCSTQDLVIANGQAFARLRDPLALSWDDFIHTSTDPRHRPGVERLWQACAASGDLYQKDYDGLYCVGCERFFKPAELTEGCCPEHGSRPQQITERNYFFRLSRYAGQLTDLITSGRLRIEPAARRNEVLGFIAAGLEDFSASRSTARARGWGIPVPGDPGQVIYVWWDALGNYITAPGYGTDAEAYRHWWTGADRRIHLVGKGVLRFHAVYWPAILLSAGEPLPTEIAVHDYLTVDGAKISKSAANGPADPAELVARYGTDAVRWWLLRAVPRVGDVDFTEERLVDRANHDLANGLGNLVSRVTSLAYGRQEAASSRTARSAAAFDAAHGETTAEAAAAAAELRGAAARAPQRVRDALDCFDSRTAIEALWQIIELANRYAEVTEPWHLARTARAGDAAAAARLDAILDTLLDACQVLAAELSPFLPGLSARVAAACGGPAGILPRPRPLFPRLAALPPVPPPPAAPPPVPPPPAAQSPVPSAPVPSAPAPPAAPPGLRAAR